MGTSGLAPGNLGQVQASLDTCNSYQRIELQMMTSENDGMSSYDCHICLAVASDPVVTLCGHLYCWPCLFEWMSHHTPPTCPVCKAGVTEEKLIPLYVRGGGRQEDSCRGGNVPRRPAARPEPVRTPAQGGVALPAFDAQADRNAVAASFGLFPSLFGLQFQPLRVFPSTTDTEDQLRRQDLLARFALGLGTVIIFALLLL